MSQLLLQKIIIAYVVRYIFLKYDKTARETPHLSHVGNEPFWRLVTTS